MAKEGCVVPVGWPPPPSTHARIFHNGEATKRYSDFSAALLRPTFARGHRSPVRHMVLVHTPGSIPFKRVSGADAGTAGRRVENLTLM